MRCSAFGKKCLNCNKFNQFSRMCNVYGMQSKGPTDQVIYCFNGSRSDWSIDLIFGINLVKFKLDTGADVNVLKTSINLKGYWGSDINVLGRCHVKVKYKQNVYILEFIVADVCSPPVLGRDSCSEPNVIKLVLGISGTQRTTASQMNTTSYLKG